MPIIKNAKINESYTKLDTRNVEHRSYLYWQESAVSNTRIHLNKSKLCRIISLRYRTL